jgi:hypothetical protein
MTEDPAKQAWQASVETAGPPPLEDVRKGADKFYRTIRLRNRIEYIACLIGIVVFSYQLVSAPTAFHTLGLVFLIAAIVFMAWQLHRRTDPVSPDAAGTMPIYVFQRGQLVRQRDALRSIILWYVLPLLPGFTFIIAGNGIDPEIEAAGPPIWVRWLSLFGLAAVIGFYWWITRLAARKLQRRIDEIDALTGEGG